MQSVTFMPAADLSRRVSVACFTSGSSGQVLIQRDETRADKPAHFFYAKLPPQIAAMSVLLLDPMLASGGSALCAIRHLMSVGVPLAAITFVCLISSPEGLVTLYAAYPSLAVVTGMLDERLDARKYILPGVGDFGDRYFGTVAEEETPTAATDKEIAGAKAFQTTNATVVVSKE